jgi:TonB-dependent receptor
MRIRLLAGTGLLALSAAPPAHAQDVAADGGEAEILVTGQRAQQERSIEIKRDALGILDAAAADEIGQLPDRNVAEVVERLPGVGVQYDQGEGRYVAVRGIPSDLNNYTINGFEVGNPDGNNRRLPLDIISGQLLNRVEVAKVRTADQPGQGIGGSINLVTQTAFDFREAFTVQATAQVGYQEMNEEFPIRGDVSVGGRFGPDQQFGLLVGASYSDRTFRSAGIYPDDWAPVDEAARGGLPINIKYTDYELKRERIGATGSFDWRPSDDHQFFLRGLYSRFTEDEYRQRYRIDFANGGQELVDDGSIALDPDGLSGTSTATAQRSDLRLEYKEKSVLALMAGGENRFGPWILDYGVARIHNEVIEPNQSWQFRNVDPVGPVDFDFTDPVFTAVPRTRVAADNLEFRTYSEQDERGEEDSWDARVNLTREFGLGSDSFVRIGGRYRTTDKSFDSGTDTYGRGNSANRFTLAGAGLVGADSIIEVGGQSYLISPTIDADAIIAFTGGRLGGPLFVFDSEGSLADETLGDLDLKEEVLAGYAMANLDLGDVDVTAGLRVERTRLDIEGFQLQNGSTVIPATAESDYTNWLPSLIVRINPAPDLVVRLAYSRSVGRPQYSALSPGGEIEVEDNEASVSLGNPALRPYVADSFDAIGEYYFARGGLLSIGAFAKIIDNPIFTRSFTVVDGSFAGVTYDRISFSQPENARSGDIIGLEAAYQQQFTFLPGALSGLGVNLTLTLVDSNLQIETPDTVRTVAFPEQSDLLWGAQLFYQRGPVEASIAYHHSGRALISADSDPIADQSNDDLRRLDAKASFAVNDHVRLFVEAQNLTDEPTRQYQWVRRDWVTQNERYGRTWQLGASVRF